MNKKIICIGIIGMFLLMTGLSAVSTAAITNVDDLPDLTVSVKEMKFGRNKGYRVTWANKADTWIYSWNYPSGQKIVFRIEVWYSGELYKSYQETYTSSVPPGINPDGELCNNTVISSTDIPRTDRDNPCIVKAWIDKSQTDWPNGVIEESNEDNNYAEIYIYNPLIRSSAKIMLLSFLEKHPLLYRLIHRLPKL